MLAQSLSGQLLPQHCRSRPHRPMEAFSGHLHLHPWLNGCLILGTHRNFPSPCLKQPNLFPQSSHTLPNPSTTHPLLRVYHGYLQFPVPKVNTHLTSCHPMPRVLHPSSHFPIQEMNSPLTRWSHMPPKIHHLPPHFFTPAASICLS